MLATNRPCDRAGALGLGGGAVVICAARFLAYGPPERRLGAPANGGDFQVRGRLGGGAAVRLTRGRF